MEFIEFLVAMVGVVFGIQGSLAIVGGEFKRGSINFLIGLAIFLAATVDIDNVINWF